MTPSSDDTQRIILPAPSIARRWPHLVVLEGPAAGMVFRLFQPETIIGRASTADIRVPSNKVSRHHAAVRLIGGEVTIEDLASRNGTFVDLDVVAEPRILRDGDYITIGDVTLLKLTYGTSRDAAVRRAGFETNTRDPETALANTLYFLDRLRAEHAYSRRHHTPLAVVFFRVGRNAGEGKIADSLHDDALREVARIVRETVRAEDFIARAADADLVALLRSDENQASGMAERIRTRVSDALRGRIGMEGVVTLTAAIVAIEAAGIIAPETILVAAHERARMAFARGADRVTRADALRADPNDDSDDGSA